MKFIKTLIKRIQKAFAIHIVSGSCECGKYAECCRKIHSNSYGRMWVETEENFRCGKVQKQVLDMKEWWDNNYGKE